MWDGVDRRMKPDYCPRHEDMMEKIHNIDKTTTELSVRINGSIDDIEHHMDVSAAWRIAIVGNLIMVFLQVITFAYLWGMASKQIAINTNRLDVIEQSEKDAQKIRYSNMTKIEELEKRVK